MRAVGGTCSGRRNRRTFVRHPEVIVLDANDPRPIPLVHHHVSALIFLRNRRRLPQLGLRVALAAFQPDDSFLAPQAALGLQRELCPRMLFSGLHVLNTNLSTFVLFQESPRVSRMPAQHPACRSNAALHRVLIIHCAVHCNGVLHLLLPDNVARLDGRLQRLLEYIAMGLPCGRSALAPLGPPFGRRHHFASAPC